MSPAESLWNEFDPNSVTVCPFLPMTFGTALHTAVGPSWNSVGVRMITPHAVDMLPVHWPPPGNWPRTERFAVLFWWLMTARAMPRGLFTLGVTGSLRYQSHAGTVSAGSSSTI